MSRSLNLISLKAFWWPNKWHQAESASLFERFQGWTFPAVLGVRDFSLFCHAHSGCGVRSGSWCSHKKWYGNSRTFFNQLKKYWFQLKHIFRPHLRAFYQQLVGFINEFFSPPISLVVNRGSFVAVVGLLWAFFSGQPLTVMGSTGPVLVFESIVTTACR